MNSPSDLGSVVAWEPTPENVEQQLRYEWWLNHGHDYYALYGDDGEMSCSACPADFKRMPLVDLHDLVVKQRMIRASEQLRGTS